MSEQMERNQLEIPNPAHNHTSNPAVPTYNIVVVSNRSWLAGMNGQPGQTLPGNSTLTPSNEPARPWGFLKGITGNDHSGWLITTLVLILVVTLSLSFGFVKGWLDAKVTLTTSVIFLVLLFGAMLVAHWPSRNPR